MENKTIQRDEITEALESLSAIKASIRGNMQLIRPAIHNRAFVRFCGFCFTGTSTFFLLYVLRNFLWPDQSVPGWFNSIIIILLIIFLVVAIFWKTTVIDRNLRATTKTMGLLGLFRIPEFVSLLMNIGMTSFFTLVVGAFIVFQAGNWWYMLPLAFIVYSFDLLQLSYALYMSEYRLTAFFGFVCALVQVIFMKGNYDLWLTGSIASMVGIIFGTLKIYGKISAE